MIAAVLLLLQQGDTDLGRKDAGQPGPCDPAADHQDSGLGHVSAKAWEGDRIEERYAGWMQRR